jgi:carboxyl-terminal processing protease
MNIFTPVAQWLPRRHRMAMRMGPALMLFGLIALSACKSSSSRSETIAPIGDKPAAALTAEDKHERALASLVVELLETEHLVPRPLDDEISRKAFDRYMKQLDAGKLFLLHEHVQALGEHADRMDDQIRQGRLELAHEGARVLGERLTAVEAMVADILARPLDLSDEEWIETDPEKLSFCESDEALRERWRQVLEYEILLRLTRMEAADEVRASGAEPPLSTVPKTPEERDQKAREEVAESYAARFARLAKLERGDHIEMFINAVAGVYDPYTTYMPPLRQEDFDISMSGSLEGIGAVLSESEHYIQVVEIVPGSASWRQGDLEAGDVILAVAEGGGEPVDVVDMRLRDVVKMIRGKKGTAVTLTVRKADQRIVVIPITRDVVEIEAAYARGALLEHRQVKSPVGYIYLPSFYGNTRARPGSTPARQSTEDVRRLLGELTKRGTDAVILDMRSNGGGLLDDARAMSGLFIRTGPIVQTRSADGEREILRDIDADIAFRGRLVVLVDSFSASAAEILAAALQDYGRAVIVGAEQTYGKGTVQVLMNLDDLARRMRVQVGPMGVFKLTRQQFFRITGASTQRRGVAADIVLPDASSHIEAGERFMDFALPWSSIEELAYEPWPDNSWDVNALSAGSRERQAGSKVFARVVERNELLRERRSKSQEPLRKETWQARREQEKKQMEELAPKLDSEPALFKVSRVDYDGSQAARKDRPRSARTTDAAKGTARGKDKDKGDTWAENLARDAWVEEALFVVRDMGK